MSTPKRQAIKVLYGWTEQNSCSWGVHEFPCEAYLFDGIFDSNNAVMFDDDGLFASHVDALLPDGEYYRTFKQAKAACLKYWKETQATAKRAIKSIRAQAAAK